jgi:hypothetical protein
LRIFDKFGFELHFDLRVFDSFEEDGDGVFSADGIFG